jgi:hypothetical protein
MSVASLSKNRPHSKKRKTFASRKNEIEKVGLDEAKFIPLPSA